MSFDLQKCIVRILKEGGETAGTGFLLNDAGLIATCAHVITSSAEPPQAGNVPLIFQATGKPGQASVVPEWWRPAQAEDVAILRLDGPLPAGVEVSLLGSTPGVAERSFDTFGFPRANQKDGLWGRGELLRATKLEEITVLQLSSKEVTPGFSGAPVVDRQNHRVIGMVTAITPTDQFGRLGETAFATPVETLRTICPELQLSDVRPFRSLEAFTEDEAPFFFGRENVIESLLVNLHKEPRLLPVLGPSGSGKSSVVRAGLIPRLRQGGHGTPHGSEHWEIVVTRPLTNPLQQLAQAMQLQLSQPADLSKDIKSWFHHADKKHLLLIFDQFEELYVTCTDDVRQDFLQQLSALLEQPLAVTVLLIMRDDFYSRLAQHETLGRMLNQGLINVPPTLKYEELDAIVRKPAASVGVSFESDDLVELIIKDAVTSDRNEISDEEGEADSTLLPLLEFTLHQLWEARQDGVLTLQAYQQIGGVTGALTQWAEQAYGNLETQEEQRLAQRIFTDLVHLGNHSQKLPDSRQRRLFSSLWRSHEEETPVRQVVQQLVEARLLVTGQDEAAQEETVEIIHDALLHEWGRLRGWLEEDQRFLLWHQKFQERLQDWVASAPTDLTQRESARLLQGSDLMEATGKWLRDRANDLSQDEKQFIQLSQEYKERQEQDWKALYEEAEQQRQIVLAQSLAAQAELLYSQRADLLELGVLLAVEAVQRFPSAETDRALRTGGLLLRRTLATFTCPALAGLFFHPDQHYLALVARSGAVALLDRPGAGLRLAPWKGRSVVFDLDLSPDGTLLALACGDGGKVIEDPVSGHLFLLNEERERDVRENMEQARTQSLLADIISLEAKSQQGVAELWDIQTHKCLGTFSQQNWVTAVRFSPDGQWLATASEDGTACLWRVADGTLLASLEHQQSVHAVAFSPDGKLLATASSDGTACVWQLPGGQQLAKLEHQKGIYAVAFSPDGKVLATASADGAAALWNVVDGRQVASLPHRHTVNTVAFSPDGQLLATASGDGTAGLWDVASGRLLISLPHQKSVHTLLFSADGQYLATASCDQTAALWDVVTGHRLASLVHPGRVKRLAFSPGGQQLITTSATNQEFVDQLAIWDIASGRRVAPFVHQGEVSHVTFSSDGALLVTTFEQEQTPMLGVWDVATGAALAFRAGRTDFAGTSFTTAEVQAALSKIAPVSLADHGDQREVLWSKQRHLQAVIDANDPSIVEIHHALEKRCLASFVHQSEIKTKVFSSDERLLATLIEQGGSEQVQLTVWEIESQRCLWSTTLTGPLHALALSEQGQWLACGNKSGLVLLQDVSGGQHPVSLTHEDAVLALAFSPDGRLLATACEDGVARIWEIATGQLVGSLVHLRPVSHVLFSPDGHYLATACRDSTARIWELATGRDLTAFMHLRPIREIAFSADGQYFATASEDWTAQVWPWRHEDLLAEAKKRLTRNLTEKEWQRYFGKEPYHKTCPALP